MIDNGEAAVPLMGESLRPNDMQRLPFRDGEPAVLLDDRNRRYYLRLQPGKIFQTHRIGLVPHDAIIGKPPGIMVKSSRDVKVVVLRPTFEEYILGFLKRQTQIIYPKDLGLILMRGNIYPGAVVLESGIGSGASALLFTRFLGSEGHLISYESRPEFAQLAQANLEEARRWLGNFGARHTVVVADVYEGIHYHDVDTILLDVPEPYRAAPHAAEALRPNGTLLCWVPTTLQVYDTVRHLQEDDRWGAIETIENLVRPWDIGLNTIRPAHRMVAHTGFLISARKLAHSNCD